MKLVTLKINNYNFFLPIDLRLNKGYRNLKTGQVLNHSFPQISGNVLVEFENTSTVKSGY